MTDSTCRFLTQSVAQTIELGRYIGCALRGSEIIALIGELGTGKTHLIKGLALGLEVPNPDDVTSPTFTIINEYQGRLPLYHVDAYRLKTPAELEALGFDEICLPSAVVVVEWADRVWPILQNYQPLCLYLEHRGPYQRAIRFENIHQYVADKISEFLAHA